MEAEKRDPANEVEKQAHINFLMDNLGKKFNDNKVTSVSEQIIITTSSLLLLLLVLLLLLLPRFRAVTFKQSQTFNPSDEFPVLV